MRVGLAAVLVLATGCAEPRDKVAPSASASAPAPSAPERSLPPACHEYVRAHEVCVEHLGGEAKQREMRALEIQRRSFEDAARNLTTEAARRSLITACQKARNALASRCATLTPP